MELLQQAMGFDDVEAIASVLKSMPPGDVKAYLSSMLGETEAAEKIAFTVLGRSGSTVDVSSKAASSAPPAQAGDGRWHRKKADDDADPYATSRGSKGQHSSAAREAAPAAAPRVGGVSVTKSKPKSKPGGGGGLSSLASIDAALIPGRHPCRCAARRHALLYNCLACGKIICAQEGRGPCLFCGCDPDTPHTPTGSGEASASTSAAAAAHKDRLLEFDRTAAKRTTVIDDQTDWYASRSRFTYDLREVYL